MTYHVDRSLTFEWKEWKNFLLIVFFLMIITLRNDSISICSLNISEGQTLSFLSLSCCSRSTDTTSNIFLRLFIADSPSDRCTESSAFTSTSLCNSWTLSIDVTLLESGSSWTSNICSIRKTFVRGQWTIISTAWRRRRFLLFSFIQIELKKVRWKDKTLKTVDEGFLPVESCLLGPLTIIDRWYVNALYWSSNFDRIR